MQCSRDSNCALKVMIIFILWFALLSAVYGCVRLYFFEVVQLAFDLLLGVRQN